MLAWKGCKLTKIPFGVSGSVGAVRRSPGSVVVGHRGDLPVPCRGPIARALLGVVLTFSVSQPDVATRLASRLHLRPLCLATWTLASSVELQPVGIPFQLCTAHGLAITLEDLSSVSVTASIAPSDRRDFDNDLLPWGLPPLRRSKLGESTSWRRLPGLCCHVPDQYRCLVTGFHTRFGPPSPFLTTLTVCASPSPVACFSHSRPWGLGSLFPACLPYFVPPFGNAQQGAGGGTTSCGLPVDGCLRSTLSGVTSAAPPPLRPCRSTCGPVPAPLLDHLFVPSTWPLAQPVVRCPSVPGFPREGPGRFLVRRTAPGRRSGLVSGVLPLVCAAPARRVTAKPDRATGNGPLRTRLRSRPGLLSSSWPLASAGIPPDLFAAPVRERSR